MYWRLNVKSLKLNILSLFVCFFPILPYYFRIFSIEVTTIFAIAIFLVYVVLAKIKKGQVVLYKLDIFDLFIIQWAVIRSLQYIFEGQIMGALNVFSRTVLIGIVIIRMIDSKERFLRTIDVVIYTAGVLAIFGIIESVIHFNIFSLLNNSGAVLNYNAERFGLLRILSFSSHTISYCVYLIFVITLTYYRLTVKREKKTLLWFIYGLLCINAILTLARSALLVLILSQLWIMYVCGFKRFLTKLFWIFIACAVFVIFSSVIGGRLAEFIENVFLMLAAVFDSSLQETISSRSFGTDNISALGTRFSLYQWVWNDVKNCLLFGRGSAAEFSHMMSIGIYINAYEKTSIEVQYLYVLFHFGLLGLISEVLTDIALVIRAYTTRKMRQDWELKIGFGMVALIVLVCYLAMMFAVNQSSDAKIFYLFCMLLVAYFKHGGFTEAKSTLYKQENAG